jgi:hypothetical protein
VHSATTHLTQKTLKPYPTPKTDSLYEDCQNPGRARRYVSSRI